MREEYTCEYCKNTYQKGWSDEEAFAEAKETFGKPPTEWNGGIAIVCDDCYQKMNPKDFPDLVENAKKIL